MLSTSISINIWTSISYVKYDMNETALDDVVEDYGTDPNPDLAWCDDLSL